MITPRREVELKYLLDAPQRPSLPSDWSLVGEPKRSVLHDEYLDLDGRLAAIGLRLRRRHETDGAILYTLKSTGAGTQDRALHDRLEIEASELFGSPIAAAIATAAERVGGGAIDLGTLATTLSITQRRSEQRLAHRGVECATLSIDEVEARRHGASVSWNELEIEFDEGDGVARDRAVELDAQLRSIEQIEPSGLSKPQRAELLLSR